MATKEEISSRLIEIVERYIPEDEKPDEINFNGHLTKDLGINSMHLVDIVIDIEDEYDIVIEDEEIRKMDTLKASVEVVQAKLDNK